MRGGLGTGWGADITFLDLLRPCIVGCRGCLASDWYSIGVLAFRCLAGRLPFDGVSRTVVQRNVLRNAVRWDILPPHLSETVVSFLRGLLHPDPTLRLGSSGGWMEVLAHPFFEVSCQ
jgi:serine/threonine protein kinase